MFTNGACRREGGMTCSVRQPPLIYRALAAKLTGFIYELFAAWQLEGVDGQLAADGAAQLRGNVIFG